MKRSIPRSLIFATALVIGLMAVNVTTLYEIDRAQESIRSASVAGVPPIEVNEALLPRAFFEPAAFDPQVDYAKTLPVKLLGTGEFHADEVPYRNGERWLGLFRFENGYELRSTKLLKSDDVTGGLHDTKVSTSHGDNAVFLLRGAKNLRTGQVVTVFDNQTDDEFGNLSANVVRGFSLNGDFWKLEVQASDSPENTERTLLLKDPVNDIQILRFKADCDDCSWTVNWVGDLNSDGKLDFLLDLSTHYNVSQSTLFLSTDATDSQLVKVFAAFRTVGC